MPEQTWHTKSRSKTQDKRLEVEGFSIVNGVQTITSAAQFLKDNEDNPDANIADARVAITIIEVAPNVILEKPSPRPETIKIRSQRLTSRLWTMNRNA